MPEVKGYWIPDRVNSQIIKQNKNVDIFIVRQVKGGVSIRISDKFAKDKLNRGRNLLAFIGLLAIGVPTSIIFHEDIADKFQDKFGNFKLAVDNIESLQGDLKQLVKKYTKISSLLHHLDLRQKWGRKSRGP
ncbi:MAG: hypothetical protein AB8G05_00025 [Oligoflexales bacterium]